ncbi:MAG: alpha/beta fold hydrolase [Gemmatimonadaceae bacterium]
MTRPSHFPDGYPGCTERQVSLADGVRLRLVEAGPPDGPPVLLVHGFGASAFQWRALMPRLAAAGWHVLAPDLPGHGFSELVLPDGEYSREAYARRLWMLLDALGAARAAVVGHSMGGAIAAEMHWQHPERVTRLALLAPAGFGRVPSRAAIMHYVPDALAPFARPFASVSAARLILGDVYGPDGSWTPDDERELLAPYAQPEIYRSMLRTLKEFNFRLHRTEALARLCEGTLVVFGTHDKVVSPVDAERRVQAVPGGRLVMLPRVGHLPQVEASDQVAALLEEYLRPVRLAGA